MHEEHLFGKRGVQHTHTTPFPESRASRTEGMASLCSSGTRSFIPLLLMMASVPTAWAEEQGSGGEADVVFDVYSLFAVLFLAGIGALMAWRVATYLLVCGCAVEEAESSRTVVRIEKKECDACDA